MHPKYCKYYDSHGLHSRDHLVETNGSLYSNHYLNGDFWTYTRNDYGVLTMVGKHGAKN